MSRHTFQRTVATILTLGILTAVLTFIGASGPIRPPTTASAPKPAPKPPEPTCHPDELWFNVHYHPRMATIEQTVCMCLHGKKECAPYLAPEEM
jgi:hypothetical protein